MFKKLFFIMAGLALLAGCGGGGGGDETTYSQPNNLPISPAPVAKFTQTELAGKTIFTSTPSTSNYFGYYDAITFNADGSISESINMSSTPPAGGTTLTGTYSIDSNGVLTINIAGKTPMQAWKVSSSADTYNSYSVNTSYSSTLTEKWFYDQTLGASQALAYAKGTTIPNTSTVSGYTLKAGESVASGLNLSMIDGKEFYWAQESNQYGTVSFSNTNGTGSGAGIFSITAPNNISSSTTWNATVILSAMPIIVSDGSSIATFNIIATASNYYVVKWTIANKTGTNFIRWYFGNGASTAAATFAGNPAVASSSAVFKTADFSGKTFYWVGGNNYQQAVFNANGTLQLSSSVTTGVPSDLTTFGTWSVTNGTLQLTSTSGSVTTYTYSSTEQMSIPLSTAYYFRVIRNNGNINAFVYEPDQTKELAAAMALAIVGGPQ